MSGGVAAAAAETKIRQTSGEVMSTADRTLLGNVDPARGTWHPPCSVRFTGGSGGDRICAVRNSILSPSVFVFLKRQRRQYARSRRRRQRQASVAGCGYATASGLAMSLMTAVLLVGSVAADPRRFHAESPAAHGRQRLPSESSEGAPRRSHSDYVAAGTACIYEGHIKTDR